MPDRPLRYHTFLLSLWEEPGSESGWRGSLQNPHTGERFGFRAIAELPAFLRAWIQTHPEEKPMRD
ncbi:MAG: hypothetical protein IT317_14535 [Anaerolineales bacterium]|nr:hypothetical protein [Anaerolineales bacterium]